MCIWMDTRHLVRGVTHDRRLFPIAGLVAVALFFHVYNLGYGEFTNDETQVATATGWMSYGLVNPLFFGSIFIFDHPPARVLVNLPFILTLGTSEFVLRLPHALFGAMSVIPLYLVGKKLYGQGVALLAGAMYVVSGAGVVNGQAQGVGIYVLAVLCTLYYLVLFLQGDDGPGSAPNLVKASIALSIATYTYLEAVAFLPAMIFMVVREKGAAVLRDRQMVKAGLIYGLSLLAYAVLWLFLPIVARERGYVLSGTGNLGHFLDRAAGLGAFNVLRMGRQYVSYNSFFFAILLLVGVVAGIYWLHGHRSFQHNLVFVLPHLLVWTFLFRNMMMHPMYDLALIALLAAAGLREVIGALRGPNYVRWAAYVVIALLLGLSAWHRFVAFSQGIIEPTARNLVFFLDPNTLGIPIRAGSRAAGYYVRTHSADATEQVFTYGSGSVAYYAGRLDKSNALRERLVTGQVRTDTDLAEAISSSPDWPQVRYVVISTKHELLWNYAHAHYLLEAVVTVDDQPSLFVFDARRPAQAVSPEVIASERYDRLFQRRFGHWRETLPWFWPMARERL